jgi:hypothetical protein
MTDLMDDMPSADEETPKRLEETETPVKAAVVDPSL